MNNNLEDINKKMFLHYWEV